jgi:hypothetical protein
VLRTPRKSGGIPDSFEQDLTESSHAVIAQGVHAVESNMKYRPAPMKRSPPTYGNLPLSPLAIEPLAFSFRP